MMRRSVLWGVIISTLLVMPLSVKAAEYELFHGAVERCVMRVTLNAAGDQSSGVVAVKANSPDVGSLKRCLPTEFAVSSALESGLSRVSAVYPDVSIKSVFIGRLVNYSWMVSYLNGLPSQIKGDQKRLTKVQLETRLFESKTMRPFDTALRKHRYRLYGVSCEKIIYGDQGLPEDALCWLLIDKIKEQN